jgi:predicted ester cyclase
MTMTPAEADLPRRSHDELMIQNREAVVDEIYAEDFVNHSPGIPEDQRRGRAAVLAHNRYMHSAFSNITLVNEAPVIEGEMIGFRWIFSATHSGDFFGIPATGREVTLEGYDIMQIRDGKIVNAWVYQDTASLLTQLQPSKPA